MCIWQSYTNQPKFCHVGERIHWARASYSIISLTVFDWFKDRSFICKSIQIVALLTFGKVIGTNRKYRGTACITSKKLRTDRKFCHVWERIHWAQASYLIISLTVFDWFKDRSFICKSIQIVALLAFGKVIRLLVTPCYHAFSIVIRLDRDSNKESNK